MVGYCLFFIFVFLERDCCTELAFGPGERASRNMTGGDGGINILASCTIALTGQGSPLVSVVEISIGSSNVSLAA